MEIKNSDVILLGTCLATPSVLVLLFPSLRIAGPILMIAGFIMLIVSFLVFSFRRHKAGPFAQWTQPVKYFGMEFSKSELKLLRVSACAALGGALAIGALLITG